MEGLGFLFWESILSELNSTFSLGSRTLLMSYGLLSQISQIVGQVENIPLMTLDGGLRDDVLEALIAERNTDGVITKQIATGSLTQDEAMELVDWASGHIIDFFMKLLDRQVALQEKYDDQFKALIARQERLAANSDTSSIGSKA